jgi:thiosulfate/3-mercaptopyruvate sulfurtransferase
MRNLVTVDWLYGHLDDDNLTILDCTNGAAFDAGSGTWRTRSGISGWREARIPGSRHADFTKGLAGNDPRFRNTLPEPAAFAQALSELGVAPGHRVILYDSSQSMWAARVWWMLRWIGFDTAWMLDGGLEAWAAAGYPVEDGPDASPLCKPDARLDVKLRSECFVTASTVQAAMEDRNTVLIDALSREQFNGTGIELGLCGHIPGAFNVPAVELVDPMTRCFAAPDVLRKLFPDISGRPVIVYCGSGVAASSAAFCLNQLGVGQVAIYMPGFQEWVQLADAPVEQG